MSSLSYLLSLLPLKHHLIQLRPTRRPPHLYNPQISPEIQSWTLLFPPTGLQFLFFLPENNQSKTTAQLSPFISLLSDVRRLLSRSNQLNFQPDHSILRRQHRREYYTNHLRRTKRLRFNEHLQHNLKSKFSTLEIIFWDSRRQEYTIQSTSLPSQRLVVPPQAITSFCH